MGLLRAILETIKRLLGLGQDAPVLALSSSRAGERHDAEADADASDDDDDDDDNDDVDDDDDDDDDDSEADDDAPDTSLTSANEAVEDAWGDLQAVIARFEAEAIELGGIAPDDPADFWARENAIAQAERAGASTDAAARASGFDDAAHWYRVRAYLEATWSRRVEHDGVVEICFADGFERARARARAPSESSDARE